MAGTSTRIDPYRGFNFRVEIDNTAVASFSEVSGLAADGDTVEYREGKDAFNYKRKLPALRKSGTIACKRGYTKDSAMWDWYMAVATGAPTARRNGTIVLRDETQTDVIFFHFTGGLLNKIEGAHMNASGNEVAIESAEIVVESLTMQLAT
ncbi:MAG TPA: phage tail protein [Steroidobacteraceae bacterium]|nr:phage tail protein [Steroidobacteraceae bacterium]